MATRTSQLISICSVIGLVVAGGLAFSTGTSASAQPAGGGGAGGGIGTNQPERGGTGGQGGAGGREGQPEGRRGPGGPGAGGSVEGGMKAMNGAARQLKASIEDPAKRDANLKLINDMQRGAVISKGLPVPAELLKNAKDDAEKTKLANTFRSSLIKLTRALLDLEELVADGKTAEAKAKFDEIVKMKDAGHEAMGMKE